MMKKWLKTDEILIYFVSLQHTNGLWLEPRTCVEIIKQLKIRVI